VKIYKIEKVCSLSDDKPIRSNTHELSAFLAQHVRRMTIPHTTSQFWAKQVFSHVVWPYAYLKLWKPSF